MQKSDVSALKERLVELAEVYGVKPPSDAAIKVWIGVLKDFPYQDIADAFSFWARTKQKMCTPADIASQCTAKVSDRVEAMAVKEKREFAAGTQKIMGDRRIAELHLKKIYATLNRQPYTSVDIDTETEDMREMRLEREGMGQF